MKTPEYRIPSMTEIADVPWNGYNVISTFSGCGGSCLGFKLAGFRVLWANEFIPAAAEVYRLNHPDVTLNVSDIRQLRGSNSVLVNGRCIDVLEGSPPCASFSSAGVREAGWGKIKKYSDSKQRVDDLFFEFVRIVKELQPKVFVAENVAGLVKGKATGFFLEIMSKLRRAGYTTEARLLNAQFLGIPQHRERVIIIGVRKDLEVAPVFPKPFTYSYSVRDVLPHIKRLKLTGRADRWGSAALLPAGAVVQSGAQNSPTAYFSADMIETMSREKRKWTIEELKTICSFPQDFKLTGTFEQQWERLGRAVPPLMMKEIALCVRQVLDSVKTKALKQKRRAHATS